MPILYAVVAHKSSVLADYARCAGNFKQVTEQIFEKISPEQTKLTYSHGNYLFHYIYENDITYLCITDDNFSRATAFSFLKDIKRRFQFGYGSRALNALPYAMNNEFSRVLAAQMKHFSDSSSTDQLERVQNEIDDLTDIMVQNIESVANRGERLELLVGKTESLENSSVSFRTTSRNLARSMCLKNIKIIVIVTLMTVVCVYILVAAGCGGLSLPNCRK